MKKTTIKDLENKLYELEKNQYKLNDNIYKLESKLDDFKERIQSVEIRTGADLGIDVIINSQPDLLTQEEREYLSAVIKPFRSEVVSICLTMKGSEYIRITLVGYCNYVDIPVFRSEKLNWKLPLNTKYTLSELGL